MREILNRMSAAHYRSVSTWGAACKYTAVAFWIAAVFIVKSRVEAQIDVQFGSAGRPTQIKVNEGNEEIPVYIASNNVEALEEPRTTSFGRPVKGLFMKVYWLTDVVETPSGTFYLAAERQPGSLQIKKFVGWFRESDVLVGPEALKEKPGIYSKALLVTSWKSAKAGGDGHGSVKAVPVYEGPSKNAKLRGRRGLFKFYFIYKTYQPQGLEKFVLIGRDPEIADLNSPLSIIEGWVPYDRIARWDTRQAVYFNKNNLADRTAHLSESQIDNREGGVKIFRTAEEARNYAIGEDGAEPLAEEDLRLLSIPHYLQRFPLIKTEYGSVQSGDIYKIGFIGDQFYEGENSGGGRSAIELSEDMVGITRLLREMKGLDITFVVDSTGTMKKHFNGVANSVGRISQEIQSQLHPWGKVDRNCGSP